VFRSHSSSGAPRLWLGVATAAALLTAAAPAQAAPFGYASNAPAAPVAPCVPACPNAPVINDTDPDSPANNNGPKVKGTADAGLTVKLYTTADCTGTVAAQGTDAQFASPGLSVSVADNTTTSYRATATDVVGNVSSCSAPFTYVEDSTAPAAPQITATAPASPANNNSPRLLGPAEAGSTVKIYTTTDCTGTVAAQGTDAQFASPGLSVSVADNTTTSFRATATDAAGNLSACSAPRTYIEDSTAPAAPQITATNPASPANDNSPQVLGSAEAPSTVKLYKTADCSGAPVAQDTAGHFASPGLGASVADNTTTSFRATATDAAGNLSACSGSFDYREDSTAPDTTIDSGPSGTIADATPTFTFSADEPNSTFKCRFDAQPFAACSGPGASHTPSSPLADGPHTFQVRATDAAQNVDQTPASRNFTVSTGPAAPQITDTDPDSPANNNNPKVKGTAAAGSTVKLYKTSGCTGSPVAQGTAAQFASPGLSASVADNSTTLFRATATDGGGNTSPCSAPFQYLEQSGGVTPATLVKDINRGSAGSSLDGFLNGGGKLLFGARDATHGKELWKSDGTAAGTKLLKDIVPGSASSSPVELMNVGGKYFFVAKDVAHGPELWRSDGTAPGTKLVKDIRAGSGGSSPQELTKLAATLYFEASTPAAGMELWKSDGTAAGTKLVRDIKAGGASSNPSSLAAVGGTLFFSAEDATHGAELWKSDGTAAGTRLVRDIKPGGGDSFPVGLTNVGGTLFFSADDGTHGFELWKSDGTAAGTQLVKDIFLGSGDSFPDELTIAGSTLLFSATGRATGRELFRSDGTATGTKAVQDIKPGKGDSSPENLTSVAGVLFFGARNGTQGQELWRSDGTSAGTQLVQDINPSNGSSDPQGLTNVAGTLFFEATEPTDGAELWRSNGTAAGTQLVKDINPGNANSDPQDLTNVVGRLFFGATDPTHGFELWRASP
jgi:ELWxxDGT repeat protein